MTGDYIYQLYTQLAPEYFLYDKTIRRICKTGIILLMFDLKDWHNCYVDIIDSLVLFPKLLSLDHTYMLVAHMNKAIFS